MTIHAMSKRFPTASALALITFVLLVGPALAAPISYNVDLNTDNQFGGLKQTDVTGCEGDPAGQLACGPAAAVNSFVFLENVYPKTYDHKLSRWRRVHGMRGVQRRHDQAGLLRREEEIPRAESPGQYDVQDGREPGAQKRWNHTFQLAFR